MGVAAFIALTTILTGCTSFDASVSVVLPDESEPDVEVTPPACPEGLAAVEGDFVPQGTRFEGDRPACISAVHATAGAAGSTVAVRLDSWTAAEPAHVKVLDLLGNTMVDSVAMEAGDELEVDLVQSGEVLVQIEPTDPEAASNAYAVSVECLDGCSLEYTRYPIVLLHGAAPSEFGGLMDYFFEVRDTLTERGFLVLTPTVDPWESSEDRGAAFYEQIEVYAAEGLGRHFNLIGHSQAGLDARYITTALDVDQQVVSVTTLSSPHRGAPLADIAAGVLELSPWDGALVDAAASAAAMVLGNDSEQATACLASMTTEATTRFNAEVPDRADVAYYSWSGRTCGVLEFGCQSDTGGEVVASYLAAPYDVTALVSGENDGLVPVSSAQWGEYLGEMPADHFDQVGQIAGLDEGPFDHLAFFESEANRLANAGF